ncbi:MAG: VIT family protein [Steroidobacteraceae bacterium]
MRVRRHIERHRAHRIGWLRAGVLGANDGLISTASLILGVAAAGTDAHGVITAGVAGLMAGAASMAAGEYVSVSSQADTERADLDRERKELASDYAAERRELAGIYAGRGLTPELAQQVADQLMAHDALGAHARDELGLAEMLAARPVQAALASAMSFAVGAIFPLIVAALAPESILAWAVSAISVGLLAVLGALAANIGGARLSTGAWRVTFWGALAMGVTTAAGSLFGAVA